MANAKNKVRTLAVPNVTIAACKLRRPYNGKFGLQYGAHLSGDGLAEIGLKQADDGGFWYSTNAKYGAMDVDVPPVSIQDAEGVDIEGDLENGSVAHLLFEFRDYPAGKRKDGTTFKAGSNVRIAAVRAVSFELKRSKQDALTAALLELDIASKPATGSDSPF
jgi:hypothetical protein